MIARRYVTSHAHKSPKRVIYIIYDNPWKADIIDTVNDY